MKRIEELPDREVMLIRRAPSGDTNRDYGKEIDGELSGKPYKNDMKMRGIEPCERCDDTVCMGWIEVVGTDRGTSVRISYREVHEIEKHYSPSKHNTIIGNLAAVLNNE